MIEDEKALGFIRHNPRTPKPRTTSVTEIRGPYYSAMGKNYLRDLLDTYAGQSKELSWKMN